jgi:hypothetical protein
MRSPARIPQELQDLSASVAAVGLQLREELDVTLKQPVPNRLVDTLIRLAEVRETTPYWRRYH